MPCNEPYGKWRLTLPEGEWTRLVAAFDCNSVGIKNPTQADIWIRTDADDPMTGDTIYPNAQEVISSPQETRNVYPAECPRFRAGATICFLKPSSGTGPAVITFLR